MLRSASYDYAAYLQRDSLNPVFGFGMIFWLHGRHQSRLDCNGAARRFALDIAKSWRLTGHILLHCLRADTRNWRLSCNQQVFDFAVAEEMAKVVNHMIGELAPR